MPNLHSITNGGTWALFEWLPDASTLQSYIRPPEIIEHVKREVDRICPNSWTFSL